MACCFLPDICNGAEEHLAWEAGDFLGPLNILLVPMLSIALTRFHSPWPSFAISDVLM